MKPQRLERDWRRLWDATVVDSNLDGIPELIGTLSRNLA
jgi:hypothetical protein